MARRGEALRAIGAVVLVAWCAWASATDLRATQKAAADKDAAFAALVNGEPITRGEVARLVASPVERRQLLQEAGGAKKAQSTKLDRLALQTLIRRRLILQEAARRNFTIPDEEVDKAVTTLRRRFADLKGLGTWMREQGLDERSLFSTLRAEALAARVRHALVEDVRVTDEQASEYYEAHKHELTIEQVRLQIIVVQDEAAAREILSELERGGNFHTIAQQRSRGARASRGGDAGWRDVAGLPAHLRGAVAAMKPRQARGPLQRGDEFLIVRLEDRRVSTPQTLAEARAEVERRLLPLKQRQAVELWLTEQEKKSRIEVFRDAN